MEAGHQGNREVERDSAQDFSHERGELLKDAFRLDKKFIRNS